MSMVTSAKILELARDLAWELKYPGQSRCAVCGFVLAYKADYGCVVGNCSYRPDEGSSEYERVCRNRHELALQETIIVAAIEHMLGR